MEVKFHLPGLRRNYPLNVMLLGMLKGQPHLFREGVTIGSCFGEFPTSLWNGGRNSMGDQCSNDYINMVIKSLNGWGVPVRFTYTNTAIDENDLNDPYCNYCLKVAHNGMNGVIVVSPILEEYVRKNYPKMHIISSTCKEIRGIDGVNEELGKGYDIVVLDYNLNNKFEELEKITDKSRCEVLVNAICAPNCPMRGAHYRNISENQKKITGNMKLPKEQWTPTEPWNYKGCSGSQNVYTIQNFSTYVSPEAIWEKYVPMGFRNFKIEGRSDDLLVVMEAYIHYMIKPEFQGQVRIMMLKNLQKLNILQINKPHQFQ
ncbi:MAG: U32 family peptidase [Lachnospiraceae bacterium]|nr:U32 family peptidase [Lachnospiraceae bacterium]